MPFLETSALYLYGEDRMLAVGAYFILKWANRRAKIGTYATALQMRKQGIPFEMALLILAHSRERFHYLHPKGKL